MCDSILPVTASVYMQRHRQSNALSIAHLDIQIQISAFREFRESLFSLLATYLAKPYKLR